MSPQIDSDGVPDKCLSFTVRSTWGHFKRVGRTTTKQTYRIPPRTVVAGMLAGMLGAERNTYYDTFAGDNSAIAITPLSTLRTVNIPTLGLGTDPEGDMTKKINGDRYSLGYQDTTGDRQRHAYEVLADPAYRIDVALEDDEFYTELRSHLTAGTSVHPPSLGKTEYLATIEDVSTDQEPVRMTPTGAYDVDSVAPISLSEAVPQSGVEYGIERSPAIMEQYQGGRRTTRFDDYVYATQADGTVRVANEELNPVTVGDRTVIFR